MSAQSRFVYSIVIRSTAEKVWNALTQSEFTRRYWCGTTWESDWKEGSPWRALIPDGRVADTGVVKEAKPFTRLVISWRNEFMPELKAEGFTTCTYDLKQSGDEVQLTLIHEIDLPDSKMIEAVSGGWPSLMSSLKSLLETGAPLASTEKWPEGM